MDVATGKLHIFKGCRHVQNGMTRRSHCGPALDGLDPSASQSCLTEDLSENGVPPNLRVNHMKSPLLQYGHFLSLPRFQTHTHTCFGGKRTPDAVLPPPEVFFATSKTWNRVDGEGQRMKIWMLGKSMV